ncbi:MAG: hypothetical protein R8G66_23405 [Cytophagales bacterium]|nr:hypothetical protein [Cytophagales bacterium]
MKFSLRFLSAFILTAAIYYSIITYINYGLSGFGMIRFAGIALSGCLFFLAIRDVPWIIRLAHKMRLNRIERHGIIVLSFFLSVAQFVLVDEVSGIYHDHLLDESNQSTVAWVVDCEDPYCDYQYKVADRLLKQKIEVPDDGSGARDTITIQYHQTNPNIFRLAEAYHKP